MQLPALVLIATSLCALSVSPSARAQAPAATLSQRVAAIERLAATDPREVLARGPELLAELAAQPDAALEARVRCGLGSALLRGRRIGDAEREYERGRELAAGLAGSRIMLKVLLGLGNCGFAAGEFDRAVEHYLAARRMAEAFGDDEYTGKAAHNLSAVHQRRGEFGQAIEELGVALQIAENGDDTMQRVRIYNNLGTLHNELHQYDEALEALAVARELHRSARDGVDDYRILTNLAIAHGGVDDREQALGLFRQALELQRHAGLDHAAANSLLNIGSLLGADPATAEQGLESLDEALRVYEQLELPFETAQALANSAEAELVLGRIDAAMRRADRAAAIAERYHSQKLQLQILELRSRIREARGELGPALGDLRDAASLRRKIHAPEHVGALATLTGEGERRRRAERIAELESAVQAREAGSGQRERLLRALALAGFVGLLATVILVWRFRSKRRALAELQVAYDRILAVAQGAGELDADFDRALQTAEQSSGLIPVCSGCKCIRDRQGIWLPLEHYLDRRYKPRVTHGLCPRCQRKYA